jgi:hypothetical protein
MFAVMGMDNEGNKGFAVLTSGNRPVVFETEDEAWDFIQQKMNTEPHLRFMWIKEVAA